MAPSDDIKDARATYSSFVNALKWAVPLIAALTFFIIILIA